MTGKIFTIQSQVVSSSQSLEKFLLNKPPESDADSPENPSPRSQIEVSKLKSSNQRTLCSRARYGLRAINRRHQSCSPFIPMRQLHLIPKKQYAKRKVARAISLRGANHIVLKSLRPNLRRHHTAIRAVLRETQDRFGVRLRALAVMPDHVHLVVQVNTRTQFANALRFLAGRIAGRVAGTKLWRTRAWSRPMATHRDQETVERYVARNPIKAGSWTLSDSYFILAGVLQH